jgi:hypothetical protein
MLYVVARYNTQQCHSLPGRDMRLAHLPRAGRAAASSFLAMLATVTISDDGDQTVC